MESVYFLFATSKSYTIQFVSTKEIRRKELVLVHSFLPFLYDSVGQFYFYWNWGNSKNVIHFELPLSIRKQIQFSWWNPLCSSFRSKGDDGGCGWTIERERCLIWKVQKGFCEGRKWSFDLCIAWCLMFGSCIFLLCHIWRTLRVDFVLHSTNFVSQKRSRLLHKMSLEVCLMLRESSAGVRKEEGRMGTVMFA